MGNARRIARRIIGLAEMNTPPRPPRDGPVCPSCDGDAELSGTPGQISCFNCGYNGPSSEAKDRPALVDPRDEQADCEECSASLPPGVDPIDVGWTVGQKDGEFLCEECKMNPDDDPGYF